MATNRVLCLCGRYLTARQFIKHISTIWAENRILTLKSLQESHRVIESWEIVPGRVFSSEEIAQATQKRK
jgi:hypothetical protein